MDDVVTNRYIDGHPSCTAVELKRWKVKSRTQIIFAAAIFEGEKDKVDILDGSAQIEVTVGEFERAWPLITSG